MSNKYIWECPKCRQKLEVHVSLSMPPVCANKRIHTSKPQVMQLTAGDEEKALAPRAVKKK
jgi:hypothetical protein